MLVRNVLNTACTLDYYENTSHTGLFCDVIRVNSYIYFYISFFSNCREDKCYSKTR